MSKYGGVIDDDGYETVTANHDRHLENAGLLQRGSARRSSVHSMSASQRHSFSRTSSLAANRAFLLPAGGLGASVFNLCSATLGAGVLALPKCMAYSGVAAGSIMVALSGMASCYSMVVLVMIADKTGFMSYEEMSLELLGPRWVYATVFFIAALCYGTAVGYIIAIGDILDPFRKLDVSPDWLKGDAGRYYVQIAWWLIFLLPLSLPKSINSLRFASFIGVLAVGFLLCTMLEHNLANKHHPEIEMIMQEKTSALFALPVIMFGFGCQVNTFEIYTEMHKRKAYRMGWAAAIALSICTVFYVIAGVIGYSDFGHAVLGNVLRNYDPLSNGHFLVAFIGVSLTVTMAFPLCVFPTRDAIAHLIWDDPEEEMSENAHEVIVIGISLAVLLSSWFIPQITTVFGIVGGLCIGLLGYVFPALFAMNCNEWTSEKVGGWHILGTRVLLVWGLISTVLGTGISLWQMAA